MSDTAFERARDNGGYRIVETYETVKFYDDESLFKLAKLRFDERRNMILHTVAYIVVNVFLSSLMFALMLVGEIDFREVLLAITVIAGGWGIGLVMHFASYITGRTPEKIEKEYLKLKDIYGKE